MSSLRSNPILLVAVVLGGILLCCLCALLVAGGLSYRALIQPTSSPELRPTLPDFEPTITPFAGQITPSPLPDEAQDMSRELAQEVVPIADPIDIAQRLLGIERIPRTLAQQAEALEPGTVRNFWVSDVDANLNFEIEAELVYSTEHVHFWVDRDADYRLADVRALVDEFENEIYPRERAFFGSEWTPGVDGDPHIYILYARRLGPRIAGYFSSSDEYSSVINEYSNGHEMFYLNADNLGLSDEFTYGVLAHEFQHMIHWNQDRNEETWMNEGFSELATLLTGYDIGGFDFAYLQDPDVPLTFWPSESTAPHYGQSFLFLAYFLDRFEAAVTQALVANPSNGLDSVDETLSSMDIRDAQTGQVVTADDLYLDWAIALLLQDSRVEDGRYAIRIYPGAIVLPGGDAFNRCPSEAQQFSVNQYGVDYVGLQCEGEYTLSFQGSDRVQVVPAEAHSGEYAFWSNRGDESDMTLTREFDLREVEGPIELQYWVWYDIEEGWDYLYLEISPDGGDTWMILDTPSGTAEDPSGNSYGWAYTGPSGGGEEPEWILETVDLTSFAGQEVILRFEYITDAAVNGEGLLLDDVSIEAIGYQEDFEAGEGGWSGEGFVRLFNRIPQTYRVALVEIGRQTRVREIELDATQRGDIRFNLGGEYDEAVLVVVGTSRHTWRVAPYRVQILP